MKKPETKFKEKVLDDLEALPNTWAEKIQQLSIRGTPDILACINGNFVAIELKKDRAEVPEPLQVYKLSAIVKAGGTAYVAFPENWEEILQLLTSRFLKGYKRPTGH